MHKPINTWTCAYFLLFLLFQFIFKAFFIEWGVEGVEVLFVEFIGQEAEVFAEALVVDNLTGTQKANRIFYIVVIAESEDVIVGRSGFLLSRHTFVQVGYRIAFNLHWCSCIGKTCCRLWENSGCVVNKIVTESLFLDFFLGEVFRQLIYYCTDHFKMIKFLCAYVGESAFEFRQGHCKSLTQISQWRTQLTVWWVELMENPYKGDSEQTKYKISYLLLSIW